MDLDSQSFDYEPLTRASTRRVPAEAEPVKRFSLRHPSKNVHSFKDETERPMTLRRPLPGLFRCLTGWPSPCLRPSFLRNL